MSIIRFINRVLIARWLLRKQKKQLTRKDKFNISMSKINSYIMNIKYSNLPVIVRTFDSMKIELANAIQTRPWFENINISGYEFKELQDLEQIEQIRKEYIKAFLLEKTDLELKKSESVDDPHIKITYIKKALHTALRSVEFLPDDPEMKCKIMELENKLKNN